MLEVGTILGGRFRVEYVLGAGGMGTVVAARNVQLDQKVAIKVLQDRFASDREAVERLLREARVVAKLRGEHVCRVIDVGELDSGAPFVVMELLKGRDLARIFADGLLPVATAVGHVVQACLGIAEAHAHGIIHRDLKAANLFVTRSLDGAPLVKILDFGVAKSSADVAAALTPSDEMLGTPSYMAPEQLRSTRDVDARADIWALGVILYQAIVGRLPFPATSSAEVVAKIATEPPEPFDAPVALRDAILRCLEKEPSARYGDVAELAAAIAPFGTPATANDAALARALLTPVAEADSLNTSASAEPTAHRTTQPTWPKAPSGETMPDFGARYRVITRLGAGGMGLVYRAYDAVLKGEVALKIIHPGPDVTAALTRFRREIALARKVTSPNVLRVHDLAEYRDLQFLSMEYIDGEDLGELLVREKRLPLHRALPLFRQVCMGLAAAHAEGIIHRDLKPRNVLIDQGGRVHVGDFGLARSADHSALTPHGKVLGSPAYMSPEQVRGKVTDERGDIYALGVLLYELLTGTVPFEGETPHAMMAARLHEPPPSLAARGATDVPGYVRRIVSRCLQIDPAKRYASVNELIEELDQQRSSAPLLPPRRTRVRVVIPALFATAVLASAATILLSGQGTGRPASQASVREPPVATAPLDMPGTGLITVIVLPFENRTSEPKFEDTLEAMFDFSLRRSERIDPIFGADLRVLAAELGQGVSLDDVGRRLAARDHVPVLVARGRIAPQGAGFTLSLTVKDAAHPARVFETPMQAPALDDVLSADIALASALRAELGEQLSPAERSSNSLSPSLEAVYEQIHGAQLVTTGDDENARPHLERAIAKDPQFALAQNNLGAALRNLGRDAEAASHFAAALRSLDRLGERDRLKILGDYYTNVTEDFERAVASYQQLLAKWSTDRVAEVNGAMAYYSMSNATAALNLGQRAAHDHPRDLTIRGNLALLELNAGQFDASKHAAEQIVRDFARPSIFAYAPLALADVMTHDRVGALAAYWECVANAPSQGTLLTADFAIGEGRLEDGAKLLEDRSAIDLHDHAVDAYENAQAMLAELRVRQGDKGAARVAASHVTKEPALLQIAAFVELAVGDDKPARAIAAKLAKELAPSRRAIAKAIEAEALRVHGKPLDAMLAFQEVVKLVDSPLYHFWLARAAIDASRFPEAYHELGLAIARRGEVLIDSEIRPLYRYVPLFTYYLARAQAGLGSSDAKASYQAFLAMLHDPDPHDPFAADARAHVK
jgi:serine/threonine protein kinase/tetratricopeptide (TPR) repeat protein